MRLDHRLVGVGLFFIVFGAVLLAARQGWITGDVVGRAWQLWPLLLIGIGLSVLLGGRPGAQIGGLVVAASLGVMAAALVTSGGGFPFIGCGSDRSATPFATASGELAGRSRIDVSFRCGDLDVRTAAGTSWIVEGSSEGGRAPHIEGREGGLQIGAAEDDDGLFGFGQSRERWTVILPTDVLLVLGVTLNAGSGTLNLDGAQLEMVVLVVNAGSVELDLREVASIDTVESTVNAGSAVVRLPERALEGDLVVNAGSLSICAPEGVGLRLTTGDNPISSNDFAEQGLVRVGEAWESPTFATAPIRIALDVQANAGSLSLNPQPACAG
jgi:hypothetical protein